MSTKVKTCPEGFVHIPAGSWQIPVYRRPVTIDADNQIVDNGYIYEEKGTGYNVHRELVDKPEYINLTFYLNEFCISETEITNEAYHAVVQRAGELIRKRYDVIALNCDGSRTTLFSKSDKESLLHFNTPLQFPQALAAREMCGLQINENSEAASDSKVSGSGNPLTAGYDAPQQPVVNVNWYEAETFCESIGGHLPSSAQWFRAAEDINIDEYSIRIIPYKQNEPAKEKRPTMPVKSYPPSPLGMFDLVDNVAEWCLDDVSLRTRIDVYAEKDQYGKLKLGRGAVYEQYGPNPEAMQKFMPQDPVYRSNRTFFKALHGGSWHQQGSLAKVWHETPNTADLAIGLRCVVPVREIEAPVAVKTSQKRK